MSSFFSDLITNMLSPSGNPNQKKKITVREYDAIIDSIDVMADEIDVLLTKGEEMSTAMEALTLEVTRTKENQSAAAEKINTIAADIKSATDELKALVEKINANAADEAAINEIVEKLKASNDALASAI